MTSTDFDWMREGWRGGLPHTVCGNGSTPARTANVRRALPEWCRKYRLRVVNDAGAGDMAWRRDMVWDVEYHPFDLFPREQAVRAWDITAEPLPECDLIVCRMVLIHLDEAQVNAAIGHFRASARYLAATTYVGANLPNRSPTFRRYDLTSLLGKPLERVQDGDEAWCELALWRL